ncbi:MAG: transposase [Candidatus Pristimantibacillus sp.]
MTIASAIDQFELRFPTEEACLSYLIGLKWPNGYRCPRCKNCSAFTITTRNSPLYECRSCRHQTTLTAGTIMEKSRTSMRKWLLTIFLVTQSNSTVNAVWLSEYLEVTYKTAWAMLHKIRQAIHQMDNNILLEGEMKAAVEHYGKPHNPTISKHSQEHPVLVSAACEPHTPTYYKFKVIPLEHLNGKTITRYGEKEFRKEYVSNKNKNPLIVHQLYRQGDTRFIRSLFKKASKWMNTAFRGIGRHYLQFYLDEFCFRLNFSTHQDVLSHLSELCLSSPLVRKHPINLKTTLLDSTSAA